MNIFERLKSGEPIHMKNVKEYHAVAHKEMDRCRKLCFSINHTMPEKDVIWEMENELFGKALPSSAHFTPPFQIDYLPLLAIQQMY